MQGIDTNVLIRYLVQDDPRQAKIANTFIENTCSGENPGFIGHIVLCELAWVLESNYSQSRADISSIIEGLLQIEQLSIQEPDTVWRALSDYRSSNVDFPDHLLARAHQSNRCDTTFTFDKKASRQAAFELLS